MMDITERQQILQEYATNVLSGQLPGITTGYEILDGFTGRLQSGQVWLIGGYSGVGKSFFALNMVDKIQEKNPGLCVQLYSTELSSKQYLLRHMFMRGGMYKLVFENQPQKYQKQIKKILGEYVVSTAGRQLEIYGGVSRWEQIEKNITKTKPDVAMVDYIQELSVGSSVRAKDAMPVIAAKIKQLAVSTGIPIIVVSQITNQGNREGVFTTTAPFDYGKELNRAAHTSIYLVRDKDKSTGELEKVLKVHVFKARDGSTGMIFMKINDGYRLGVISKHEAADFLANNNG